MSKISDLLAMLLSLSSIPFFFFFFFFFFQTTTDFSTYNLPSFINASHRSSECTSKNKEQWRKEK
ncbi:hypothetical protein EJD97_000894 [Solanum chilense]|uniref:Uncharacterized protein n=1 Tax=Solanum chilense TaxID=4083 RepID=A0A6N2APL1_SOLCI|nr:hypothetical protein EJD97_000894 [Solanum chilense]